ncbi:NAD(P)/FAD-dependent oxidoreductase [Streptomyces sp. H10-C2]|uniref:FAD-dependent oxidoreductase n=1 Tax=unclassified Streptomyces TaxID=2593676 RepID=UPI0024B9DDAC|nr:MULTISPECIES: NAD(P)/FAD-dependent oxidoreductase [unclassified Streptomyces]MDJ0345983.1 NAD(P)/FAD-dependent oxidoreductase [Streptomyces sp. PH10-H1]MDJ0370510.1 NAD(P)/FAD-dependent oxidoreductase [Streptomyces sp. H10-C2]
MRTTHSPMHVLVIGGGIGGLCLAQGLHRAGVAVTVYERDESPEGRRQGYRLRISPEGEYALRECLPPALLELLTATSNERDDAGLVAYDEHLVQQWAPAFDDPRGDSPDKIDAVDRVTLRRILLAGLGDVVRFGKTFERYEQNADGRVVAHFEDGTRAEGDVLVAADGTNSRIRAQARPWDVPKDLGVRTVFSRIPRASAVSGGMPEVLRDRFSYVIGSDGHHIGLMPMTFRSRPTEAAARLWPDAALEDTDDYYMSVFNVHGEDLGMTDEAFFALSGEELCRLVVERTRSWHPDLRGIFGHAEPEATFAVALRATTPVEAWEDGPVIPLGDAVHTMPPSGGVGANTAVRDAAALTRALVAVERGEQERSAAFAEYQKAMVEYATEGVQMSLKIAQWSIKKVQDV